MKADYEADTIYLYNRKTAAILEPWGKLCTFSVRLLAQWGRGSIQFEGIKNPELLRHDSPKLVTAITILRLS